MQNTTSQNKKGKLRQVRDNYNLSVIIVPTIIVIGLFLAFMLSSNTVNVVETIRVFLTQELGIYYLLLGVGFVAVAIYLATGRLGKIKLGGSNDKPMNTFTWGALIFTSTMAADILFYALHEWSLYYNMQALDTVGSSASQNVMWSETYPLFHWGITPWLFYLVPAVAYAFMFFVKKTRDKQRVSEACRPLLGKKVDGPLGKVIDIVMVLGLLLGTSTTFSVATPLITALICKLFGLAMTNWITVIVLLGIASVYTLGVIGGFKSIDLISKIAVILTSILLALFFIFGGPRFILESGLEGLGNMLSNFFRLSTWTDPARATNIPQDWTIFYWSYWIAWAVATPLFIAKISKGRTIRQMLVGGLTAGLLGTFTSFMVLGGAGLHSQVSGSFDMVGLIESGASAAECIVELIATLPLSNFIMILLVLCMTLLYATTFDTIAHTMASYMTKSLDLDAEPSKGSKLFWSFIFIILPIALIFSESTTQGLKAMSIIGALPLSIVFIMVIISFIKEAKAYDNRWRNTQILMMRSDRALLDTIHKQIAQDMINSTDSRIDLDSQNGSTVENETKENETSNG